MPARARAAIVPLGYEGLEDALRVPADEDEDEADEEDVGEGIGEVEGEMTLNPPAWRARRSPLKFTIST